MIPEYQFGFQREDNAIPPAVHRSVREAMRGEVTFVIFIVDADPVEGHLSRKNAEKHHRKNSNEFLVATSEYRNDHRIRSQAHRIRRATNKKGVRSISDDSEPLTGGEFPQGRKCQDKNVERFKNYDLFTEFDDGAERETEMGARSMENDPSLMTKEVVPRGCKYECQISESLKTRERAPEFDDSAKRKTKRRGLIRTDNYKPETVETGEEPIEVKIKNDDPHEGNRKALENGVQFTIDEDTELQGCNQKEPQKIFYLLIPAMPNPLSRDLDGMAEMKDKPKLESFVHSQPVTSRPVRSNTETTTRQNLAKNVNQKITYAATTSTSLTLSPVVTDPSMSEEDLYLWLQKHRLDWAQLLNDSQLEAIRNVRPVFRTQLCPVHNNCV
ncbi:hypothetical protein AAG570_013707 [Ranatra chinensis]|uniref:Uncharacterized protein n=1 Tax=Ranatra chinensis TaxID=642074 RepID=A0ABD0YPL0_9HEMI